MSLRFRFAVSALFVVVAQQVAVGCASVSMDGSASPGPPTVDDPGNHFSVVDAAFDDAKAQDSGAMNPLCGIVGFCYRNGPDDPMACAEADSGAVVSTDSGRGSVQDGGRKTGGGGAPSFDAGVEASSGATQDASDASTDASLNGDVGVPDARAEGGVNIIDGSAPGAGGAPGFPSDAGPALACQVGPDDTYGKPVHRCGPAGSGGVKSPCASSSNCRAGLACVGEGSGDGSAGQCLPYCCDPRTQCAPGSFCVEKPLVAVSARSALHVPVCAPAEVCALLQPFPCTGTNCCPADTACTVVGSAGLTGCVKPGNGVTGEACPCAANYYCSQATSTCVKMCKTTDESTCAPGRCQASAAFPENYGLCVGKEPAVR